MKTEMTSAAIQTPRKSAKQPALWLAVKAAKSITIRALANSRLCTAALAAAGAAAYIYALTEQMTLALAAVILSGSTLAFAHLTYIAMKGGKL